jgi:uncharacterized Fe-S radical SAM superfamily protein PflX
LFCQVYEFSQVSFTHKINYPGAWLHWFIRSLNSVSCENVKLMWLPSHRTLVGFEVLKAMVIKSTVFWDITACGYISEDSTLH